MAQEAKSPPAGMATGGAGDNPFDIKGTSASDIGEDSSFALDPAAGAEGQKKLSLAERLRAEQLRFLLALLVLLVCLRMGWSLVAPPAEMFSLSTDTGGH